jgi:hypothetical protein
MLCYYSVIIASKGNIKKISPIHTYTNTPHTTHHTPHTTHHTPHTTEIEGNLSITENCHPKDFLPLLKIKRVPIKDCRFMQYVNPM